MLIENRNDVVYVLTSVCTRNTHTQNYKTQNIG